MKLRTLTCLAVLFLLAQQFIDALTSQYPQSAASLRILALAVVFMFVDNTFAAVLNAIDRQKLYAYVALIGLAHGYTLLWAGFTSLAELVALRGWWRRVGTLVSIHGPTCGELATVTGVSHSWTRYPLAIATAAHLTRSGHASGRGTR